MRIILMTLILITINLFSQDKGTITGIITDNETKQPVRDAIIEIIELQKKTTSGNEGKFDFKNLPYNTYQVKGEPDSSRTFPRFKSNSFFSEHSPTPKYGNTWGQSLFGHPMLLL